MSVSFECMQCEADFELELADLLRNPALSCPNCGLKTDPDIVEAALSTLDEGLALLGRLRKKFRFELTIDSDDLDLDDEEFADDDDDLWANDVEEEEEEE